jgi:hypothetical protein
MVTEARRPSLLLSAPSIGPTHAAQRRQIAERSQRAAAAALAAMRREREQPEPAANDEASRGDLERA